MKQTPLFYIIELTFRRLFQDQIQEKKGGQMRFFQKKKRKTLDFFFFNKLGRKIIHGTKFKDRVYRWRADASSRGKKGFSSFFLKRRESKEGRKDHRRDI